MYLSFCAQLVLFCTICILTTDAAIDSDLFPVEPLVMPDPRIKSFEIHMYIRYRYTMSLYSERWPRQGPKNEPPKTIDYKTETDSFIQRDNLNFNFPCDKRVNIGNEEIRQAYKTDRFIFGAGTHRQVLTVNGRYPGPTFVVNQHSNLTVYVHNELINEVRKLKNIHLSFVLI